ncbi:lysophospholipid acyltransferase family protein [Mycoplasmopsis pullorum]|uniref:1-acyl-sn-glycerol-3-phosphate acyltransferase n=1 Tax=Mycoplasmopsis pullorum TaxID=48003 RepID=A0A1L4FSI0_9BACT|nr:lysophospholipid acyltransferase family protein [Mycoplasmopsis pullorum]APJ38556.1 1-acyl-sn-glycerol-3-phosphate acyltransferase [Mycoplasmopsis pullorum]TNK82335.1 1-acyl-sn-glycerol-3-phosphate acyltransferase [Mycoplasmopsis pullorum]TNK82642.1 1-acyl-sn-glycerol-3-phosphate acyltransferase [Mycoplasmopsis pullorum]TNK84475.1 1-acyl-sn-glycerol-3-phosphate acyltransferase [Mycoplasmopsis pullorum]TNK84542.1 1-acyl-sn-glycerol-3-phosphate acyltransferase [Mycoplasmopsis pullorum]
MSLIILKKILFGPIWLIRMMRINSQARKYRRTPDMLTEQQRNDFLLKYAKKLLKLYRVKVEVQGYDNLPNNGGVILTPNHKSNADALIMLQALEKQSYEQSEVNKIPTFIAKQELLKKRLIRNAMSLIDTFAIDRNNFRQSLEVLGEFGRFVKMNKTYGVIFPEGTRVSTPNELGEFKGGAFKVAQNEFLQVVPVTISNSSEAFNSKRAKKLVVTVTFHKPIKPMDFIGQEPKAVGERVRKIVESEIK